MAHQFQRWFLTDIVYCNDLFHYSKNMWHLQPDITDGGGNFFHRVSTLTFYTGRLDSGCFVFGCLRGTTLFCLLPILPFASFNTASKALLLLLNIPCCCCTASLCLISFFAFSRVSSDSICKHLDSDLSLMPTTKQS